MFNRNWLLMLGRNLLLMLGVLLLLFGCSSPAEKYYKQAKRFHDWGENEKAIEYFEKAKEADPQYYRTYRRLAAVYEDEGQPEKAIDTFQQGIKATPDYFKNYRELAKLYVSLKRLEEAKEICLQALGRPAIKKDRDEREELEDWLAKIEDFMAHPEKLEGAACQLK